MTIRFYGGQSELALIWHDWVANTPMRGAWRVAHLANPREVVPVSIMPAYAFLQERELRFDDVADHLRALSVVGVRYNIATIVNASEDVRVQATGQNTDALLARYPGARIGDFDGHPDRITEMDALVAYLQVLGTMVDFSDIRLDEGKKYAMSQSFISTVFNGWLVTASLLFTVIVQRTFCSSVRTEMDRNGLIPFENDGDEQ